MPTAIILDVETTQRESTADAKLEVIELAYKRLDPGPNAARVRRYKPITPSGWGALAVHHILPEELVGCPPSSTAAGDVPQADYWIGHNIDFDWRALGSPPVRRICTLALSRAAFPQLDSHTLTAMTYYVQGANAATRDKLRNAHSAGVDIELTHDLLNFLSDHHGSPSLEVLWDLSQEARIPRKMPFGKFRDQPISAVDRGYASWYARQPDPDQYVLEAFRRQGLLR